MEEQQDVYNTLIPNIEDEREDIFFLDAQGETFKIYIIKLFLVKLRQMKHNSLAVVNAYLKLFETLQEREGNMYHQLWFYKRQTLQRFQIDHLE